MRVRILLDRAPIFVLIAGLAVACAGGQDVPDASGEEGSRPNVLLVFVDDLGWMDLGVYGSEIYETPHIDRLAEEGMRFTDAYAAAAVCSPTRASLLTGQSPPRVGITDWIPGRSSRPYEPLRAPEDLNHLPHADTTLAEAFRDDGYGTHFLGKWHLGGVEENSLPTAHGFMTNVGGDASGNPGSGGFFSPYNITQIADTVEGEYLTKRLTDEALRVIDREASDDPRNGAGGDAREDGGRADRPFFLMMSYYTVHRPLQAPDSLIAYYEEKIAEHEYENPPFVVDQNPDAPAYEETSWEEKQAWGQNEALFAQGGFNDRRVVRVKRRQNHPVFAAMVHYLDHSVGRLLEKLENEGLEENTIVLFYSDNGGLASAYPGAATSEAPLRAGKGWLYEGGIRVPMIVRWPGRVEAGTVNETLFNTPDLYPTLLDLAGLEMRPGQHLDGTSIAPALLEDEAMTDRTLFWHWPHYSNHGQQSPAGAIRSGRYKLIEYYENGTRQLFDLEADRQERENLVDQRPTLADSLARELEAWRAETGADLPTPNPDYEP